VAGVDQILHAIVQQGADELRLASDQAPLVFARGVPRHFSMSPTPETVLRSLLGPLLTADRLAELERTGRSAFEYRAGSVGRFEGVLGRGQHGLEAKFTALGETAARSAELAPPVVRSGARSETAAPSATPARAVEPTSPKATSSTELSTSGAPRAPAPRAAGQAAPPAERPADLPTIAMTQSFVELVEQAVAARASDLHLSESEAPYLRVDGQLRRTEASPGVAPYLDIPAPTRTDVKNGRALDVALELVEGQRLRVSIYTTRAGIAVAIRLLQRAAPALETLDLPLSLADLAEVPHGLVLFAGATGSGKSTSMAALCRRALERRSVVLVTLEEPIEFALAGTPRSIVRQREVGRDVPDFTAGLRDALRSDPDIIMVGELRDAETIRLALTAAETGHLVLASLHSGSATGVIERVVDAYPSEQRSEIRTQLADALRAVVVQRLIPRARGGGRVPALEVLRATHAVQNLVREGRTAQIGSVLQGGSRDGMLSLERCLADHVRSGVITLEHARAAANDLDSLAMYLAK
jgi:twitching motility protein PilT